MSEDALFHWLAAAFLAAAALYVLPTFVAFYRRHPNRWPILIVNIAFGATFVGWLAALVWAAHAVHKPTDPALSSGGESGVNLFANDPVRIAIEHPSATQNDPRPAGRDDLYSISQRLEKLTALHAGGAISSEEFSKFKNNILDKI